MGSAAPLLNRETLGSVSETAISLPAVAADRTANAAREHRSYTTAWEHDAMQIKAYHAKQHEVGFATAREASDSSFAACRSAQCICAGRSRRSVRFNRLHALLSIS
jgi:hypothetical protein